MKNNLIYLLGFGLSGISSISVLFFGSLLFDKNTLGVLALIIGIQFFLSQLSGIGIHFSVLYHTSEGDSKDSKTIYYLLNVLICSMFISFLFYFFFHFFSNKFYDLQLSNFTLNLSLFSIFSASNKVFISELNALRTFKSIGWLYISKSLLCFLLLLFSFIFHSNLTHFVFAVILLPEILIFIMFVISALKSINNIKFNSIILNFKRDIRFGIKAFWGSLFLDTSTKVDILVIGAYADSAVTGIYGFISLTSDIILQYITIIRSFLNPEITKKYSKNSIDVFLKFIQNKIKMSYLLSVPVIFVILVVFTYIINYVPMYQKFEGGTNTLIILTFFLSLSSGYLPLLQVFGQIGKPLIQSYSFTILFLSNLILNFILVPRFSMEGAAVATGLSYLIYIIVFRFFITKLRKNK